MDTVKLLIQITGLPGVGKTTSVTTSIEKTGNPASVRRIDIRDYRSTDDAEYFFAQAIQKARRKYNVIIAESVCGISFLPNDIIVRLEVDHKTHLSQLASRNEQYDYRYMSQLEKQIDEPDIRFNTTNDLTLWLIEKIRNNHDNTKNRTIRKN